MAQRVSYANLFDNMTDKKLGFIDDALIKEMLSKVNIVEILMDEYGIDLEHRGGGEWRGHCPYPDHRDSSASFDANENKGFYKCWGCGRGGTAIQLFMHIEGLSFKDALYKLSALSGVDVGNYDNETSRALYDIEKVVNSYIDRYRETELPAGISETEFLRNVVFRLREYEEKVDHDSEEIKWIDQVYKVLDRYDSNDDYKEMSKMWKQMGQKMKARYKVYQERVGEDE